MGKSRHLASSLVGHPDTLKGAGGGLATHWANRDYKILRCWRGPVERHDYDVPSLRTSGRQISGFERWYQYKRPLGGDQGPHGIRRVHYQGSGE